MNKHILITGGLGFIGSHTVVELLEANERVIIIDDLSNSDESTLHAIKVISKKEPIFLSFDVADINLLREVFGKYPIETVMHFAGYKSVEESVHNPLKYYRNNLNTTLSLLEVMKEFEVDKLIFSSSATVYDHQFAPPYDEKSSIGNCHNPYGWTKYMNEQILFDYVSEHDQSSLVVLRYFNPVGAHQSGLLGEKPLGVPNNLMPYIIKVARKEIDHLSVFGNDYDTPDGTGIRDYIHVVDLAKGHVAALKYIRSHSGCNTFNLGSGVGYSVLEVIREFENVNNVEVPYIITDRREGDVGISYASTKKAYNILKWRATKSLSDMCLDSWNTDTNI